MILRGSRFLRCWAHRPDEFNLQSPPWVQTVPVADVCMSRVNICVLLTNSSVACWTISSQLLIPKLPSSGIVMISCATSSVCGVLANGTTVCAGITRKLDFPTDPLTVALSSNATYAHFRLPKAQVTYPTPVRAFVDGRRGWRAVSLQTLDAPDKTNSTILVEHAFVMDAPVASWQRHGIGMPAPDILTYSQDSLSGQLLSFPCDVLSNEPQREMEGPWTPSPAGSVQHACKASAYVYGITAIDWQSSQHQHLRRPGAMTLSSAFRSPSEETRFLPPPQVLDALNLTTALAQRTGSTPRQVLLVRAGDTVTVHGTGFGVDPSKSRSVPWYTMPELDNATSFAAVGAGAPNGLAQGLTPGLRRQRSCVHLAWWATLAAYHADSTCECNGLEDWLGEGEVPVSAIRAWNDTLLSFIVPLGEGIRELRLCVEGKGLVSAPRAATSIYVAWDIPFVTSASADLLGANTGNDFTGTAAEVVVDYIAVTTQPPQVLTETWGTCNARLLPPDNMGRAHYAAPLRCEHSFVLRHCSAVPALLSSVHGCFTTVSLGNGTLDVPGGRPNCTQTLMVDVGRSSDQLLQSDGSSMSPAVLAGPGSRRLLISVPAPVPTAAFQVNFTMTVWDAGVEMSARPELRPASLFSGLPVLRSVTPNVLLLGAPRSRSGDGSRAGTGGQREPALSSTQADSAKLRLSGVGFRSVEEITNPLYGMLSYPSQLLVWLGQQHVACENASLVTAPDGSRHVDCLVPVDRIDGGEVQVLMQMAENTSLPLSALTIRCAEGSYGLFGPGHQLCLPCPLGATCREGVGLPPVASAGYYNLGFPQALDEAGVTAATAPTTSVSARVDADCPAYTDGRPLACIVACEPSQACLGANQCAQGYKSEAPMYRCAQCVDGYYRSSGLCLRCPALGAVAVLLCVLLAMAAALLGYMLSRNNVQLCTANIVLEYVQIVTLLSGPSIPWPEGVKGVLTSLSIFRLNLEVAAPECYSNIALTPSRKLVLVLAAPLLVLAVSLVTFAGLAAVKATRSAFSAYATTSSSLAVVVDEQWAVPLSGKKQTLSRRCLPSDSSAASADTWSHSASVCRATAKALGALYLPVVVSSLEVWNCTPTEPADGLLYLNVVFEPCGRSGGTQEQMKPWAIGGLALYGVLYPALLAWFFTKYDDLIVEDQLLCAAEVGDDVATNPRAYLLRQYFSPLYVDYRPGYHYASLATHARRALVSICALMLNKSPVLLSAAVAFVMAVSLAVVSTTRPLMSPGQGYASTLARFAAIASMHPNSHSHALQARIKGIAARTSVPALLRLSAGQVPSSDVASASCPWWSYPVADWNFLEAELQLQVLLTALLSVMYNAAQGSAYQVTASEAVTVVFFLLQAVAVCHICATVGYDLILQLRRAMQDLIDAADTPRGGEVNADAKCRNDSISTTNVTAGQLTFLCCCRCLLSHDRARALFRPQAATVDASRTITQRHTWAVSLQGLLGMRAGTPGAMVAPSLDAAPAWTANPIDSRGPRAEAVASPHDPQPTAPISPLSPSRHIRALALSTGMSPTGAGIMSAPESA